MLQALQNSLSPDNNTRNVATKTILDGAKKAGFIKEMLSICVMNEIDHNINL